MAPAITLTSNYVMSGTAEVAGEYIYGRYGNPSRNNLEAVLAAIEDSKYALTFATGTVEFVFDSACYERVKGFHYNY